MKHTLNDGNIEKNAVQNRFTAYLKVALRHNRMRYIRKIETQRRVEMAYLEQDGLLPELYLTDPYVELFADEVDDVRLLQALSVLHKRERTVLIQHVLQGRSLKAIATEADMPYPTVKSLYRRAIQKIRKEWMEYEF